jgi:hypothetical protein
MSSQLTLTLEEGLSVKHGSLRDCMAAGVYTRGVIRVAGKCDMAPSKLSEKLGGGNGDRKRDIGLDEFERYLEETGDVEPIHYLIDRFLRDRTDAAQAAALVQMQQLAAQMATLMQQAGMGGAAVTNRKSRR